MTSKPACPRSQPALARYAPFWHATGTLRGLGRVVRLPCSFLGSAPLQGSQAISTDHTGTLRRTVCALHCYGYIWSEVLDSATVDWFAEQAEAEGGLRAAGEKFRRSILEPGGSREAMSLVSELLGGPAPIEPLLKRRGLQ
ncbi:M3 family metallopeptidase [Pseudoclavibacter helvolus]|uniref:M3 family metallopeptidase n=1 Tax=Pseudoclavibacter helvolus TaxID=255205 RepID=UPI003735BE35